MSDDDILRCVITLFMVGIPIVWIMWNNRDT